MPGSDLYNTSCLVSSLRGASLAHLESGRCNNNEVKIVWPTSGLHDTDFLGAACKCQA